MRDLQPPPGYVSQPPTEPGLYRVIRDDDGEQIGDIVWVQTNLSGLLFVIWKGDVLLVEDIDILWGPKVEF